jgi:hypothetical protein
MLTRTTLAVWALAGCATAIDTPPDAGTSTSETTQAGESVCDTRRSTCDPLDEPWATAWCSITCRFPGRYCQNYTTDNYTWCSSHPLQCRRGFRCCDEYGLPAWPMYCVGGPIAIGPGSTEAAE